MLSGSYTIICGSKMASVIACNMIELETGNYTERNQLTLTALLAAILCTLPVGSRRAVSAVQDAGNRLGKSRSQIRFDGGTQSTEDCALFFLDVCSAIISLTHSTGQSFWDLRVQ